MCGNFSVPVNDRTIGISDSDLHIYVLPYASSFDEFVQGDYCTFLDYQNNFPGITFAFIKFDPS